MENNSLTPEAELTYYKEALGLTEGKAKNIQLYRKAAEGCIHLKQLTLTTCVCRLRNCSGYQFTQHTCPKGRWPSDIGANMSDTLKNLPANARVMADTVVLIKPDREAEIALNKRHDLTRVKGMLHWKINGKAKALSPAPAPSAAPSEDVPTPSDD